MDWITDRLPTEADADLGDGRVLIPRTPEDADGFLSWTEQHYSLIVPGQPWWSHKASNDGIPRRDYVRWRIWHSLNPIPQPEQSS